MEEAPTNEEEVPLPPAQPPTEWRGPATALAASVFLWGLTFTGRDSGALAAAHPALLGVPGEIAFSLVAAASLALRSASSRRAWWALTLGLIWASVTLWMPVYPFTQARWGFEALMGTWDVGIWPGVAWMALSLSTLTGWWMVVRHVAVEDRDEGQTTWTVAGASLGAPVVAGGALLGPDGLVAGLLVMGGVAALTWGLRRTLLAARAPDETQAMTAVDWALPALVLVLYGLLKTHGMGPSNTDENIYFYMASRLAEGEWPYVDYFFAHPPLHVLLPGGLFAITGFHLTLAKSLSAIAGGVAGWAVWSIGRARMGPVGGLVAMVAFLFAAGTLKATTNLTGVNLTVMWLMLGCRASLMGRGGRAGVFMALAACTGFYSAAPISALLLLGVFRDRSFATRQLVAFAATFGAIQGLFIASAGDAFLDGVYRYHGLKAFKDPEMWPVWSGERAPPVALWHNLGVVLSGKAFTKDLFYHSHLWLGGALAPIAGALTWALHRPKRHGIREFLSPGNLWRDPRYGWVGILWLVTLALLLEFAMFRELYSFYFLLFYGLLALCLAFVVTQGLELVREGVNPPAEGGSRALWMVSGLTLLVALSGWESWSARSMDVFPSERAQEGQRNDYTWTPAPAATGLSGVVETLFWKDHRVKGSLERGYNHYLWNKKRRFATLDEIATYVRDNSAPDETLTGSSTLAPVIALAAHRRLAANEADTNNKRFKTGMLDERAFWEAICADRVRFIVSSSMSYFTGQRMSRHPTARRWFRPVKVFNDPELKYGRTYPITLYERVGPPQDDANVCRWEGN